MADGQHYPPVDGASHPAARRLGMGVAIHVMTGTVAYLPARERRRASIPDALGQHARRLAREIAPHASTEPRSRDRARRSPSLAVSRSLRLSPGRALRLLWPYLVLWLAVASAIGAYARHEVRSTRDNELASGRAAARNLAQLLQEQVARSVEGITRTLQLIRVVHESGGGATKLASLADSLVIPGSSDIERRVLRFDRDGWLVDATEPEALRARFSVADYAWFDAARARADGGIVIGEPRMGPVSGRMVIPMAVRLTAADGRFDGVLAMALDHDRLVQSFRALRVGERSVVGLMDRNGLLYSYSMSAAGAGAGSPGGAEPVHRMLDDVADPAGMVARSAVPATDLVAFAAFSEHELLGEWRRHMRSIVGFALLTLFALTLPIALIALRALREAGRRSAIEADYEAERAQARTDPLTGIANRRAFEDALGRCHADLVRVRQPFVLAYVDVDRFKKLNDTRGHAVGDRALKRIARTLGGGVRRSDLIARIGGDEFAVLMPNADARAMRRPFDAMFTALTVAVASEGWPISFSVGVVGFEDTIPTAEDAGDLVDKLMYAVKASGRNGVRFAVWRGGRLHPDVGPRLDVRID